MNLTQSHVKWITSHSAVVHSTMHGNNPRYIKVGTLLSRDCRQRVTLAGRDVSGVDPPTAGWLEAAAGRWRPLCSWAAGGTVPTLALQRIELPIKMQLPGNYEASVQKSNSAAPKQGFAGIHKCGWSSAAGQHFIYCSVLFVAPGTRLAGSAGCGCVADVSGAVFPTLHFSN